jgi:hypothetical protein
VAADFLRKGVESIDAQRRRAAVNLDQTAYIAG